MRLAQAMALAAKESREGECTVYLCASCIFRKAEDGNIQYEATVDANGYKTCDFYDGSVIGYFHNGKWKDLL